MYKSNTLIVLQSLTNTAYNNFEWTNIKSIFRLYIDWWLYQNINCSSSKLTELNKPLTWIWLKYTIAW